MNNTSLPAMDAETKQGWVIINIGHPRTGNVYIASTVYYTRKEAIGSFTQGSGSTWRYWYRNFNFRAVRATQTIQVGVLKLKEQ